MRRLIIVVVVALAAPARLTLYAGPPAAEPFFDDTVVHRIDLLINSRDWQSLIENYLDNTYYPADFKWRDQTVRNIGIRSRGTGSRSGVKPGLRVDFNHYKSTQTFLGSLKQFILRNQTQDASNMHERISMLLYQRLGAPALREAFTTVYINGDYAGLYSIVENPDDQLVDRLFGDSGGNVYKYDYNVGDQPWYFTYEGNDPATYVPHPFKPETNELDPHPEPIRDVIQSVGTDSDAAFPLRVTQWISWENFTRHIAVENFVADQDGFNGEYGVNNFYLYRWTNASKLTFIPWDKSEAFKNSADQPIFHNFLDGDAARRNRLSARAMTIDEAKNFYLDTLLAVARSASETDPQNPSDPRGWMEREIDREYAQIKDWVYADSKKPFSNDDFEQAVASLRSFARTRPDSVVAQVTSVRSGR